MYGLHYTTNNGKPTMLINLNKNIFFPNEIIKGQINLKSGNFLQKGVIIYDIIYEEKINEKIKYNIEYNHLNTILHLSLKYPGLINYSLSKGINIPFELNLPKIILIPSFEFSNKINNKNYGYIKYYIQIKIP